EAAAARVFGQPRAGHDPDRRAHRDRHEVDDHAADDRIRETALVSVGGDLREQRHADRADPAADRDPQDPGEEHEAEPGRETAEDQRDGIARVATPVDGCRCAHRLPSLRSSRRSMSRAISNTMKVTTNSRKPSAIRAERCVPTASLNSFAIDEEIEVPGISSDALMS